MWGDVRRAGCHGNRPFAFARGIDPAYRSEKNRYELVYCWLKCFASPVTPRPFTPPVKIWSARCPNVPSFIVFPTNAYPLTISWFRSDAGLAEPSGPHVAPTYLNAWE